MSNVMLLYKQITALSQDTHGNLKLLAASGYDFAAHTDWLPVAGTEFFVAARAYPIVFAGEGTGRDEKITAIVLTGLKRGTNDYVAPDMQWRADTYVPAFVRRYPFVLATADGSRSGKAKEFVVCFDAAFPGFNTEEGVPLFNDDGTTGELLAGAVEFMNGFNNDLEGTREFIDELRRLDLFERRAAEVRSADGELFQVKDILIVDEKKFARLNGAKLAALHRKGYLGWIFAHLMSLANLPVLLDLHLARREAAKS